MPARRRDLRVPGGLAVVVGVDVDPARRDEEALGVDDAAGRAVDLADGGDDAAVDGHVTGPGRLPRPVGDGAAADDQVVHWCSSRGSAPRPASRGYTQLRSFSIMATGSAPDRRHVEVGHARLGQGGHALLDVGLGAAERRRLQELGGHQRRRLLLLARQVEVLDLGGLLLVAVAAGQRVVEVAPLGAHAADVEGGTAAAHVADGRHLGSLADGQEAAGRDLQGVERGVTLGRAGTERRAEDLLDLLGDEEDGQPAVGHLGRHGDVLLAQRGDPDRDARSAPGG